MNDLPLFFNFPLFLRSCQCCSSLHFLAFLDYNYWHGIRIKSALYSQSRLPVTGRPIIRNIYNFRCPLRLTPFLGPYVALVPITMFVTSAI